jgi:hypothetical protein
MVWQVEQMVPLFHIVHYTEIQVRIRFICRVLLSGDCDSHLLLVDKHHVLGTVHFTNTGHSSLYHRLSGSVTKKKKGK